MTTKQKTKNKIHETRTPAGGDWFAGTHNLWLSIIRKASN